MSFAGDMMKYLGSIINATAQTGVMGRHADQKRGVSGQKCYFLEP